MSAARETGGLIGDPVTLVTRDCRLLLTYVTGRMLLSPENEGVTWCRGHDIGDGRALILAVNLRGALLPEFVCPLAMALHPDVLAWADDTKEIVLETGLRLKLERVELLGWEAAIAEAQAI